MPLPASSAESSFPELFDYVPFKDERDHVVARIGISLVGSGGTWSVRLKEFMLGPQVAGIYRDHGLSAAH